MRYRILSLVALLATIILFSVTGIAQLNATNNTTTNATTNLTAPPSNVTGVAQPNATTNLTVSPGNVTGVAQPNVTLNLTGVWTCDDKGTYYMRQIGNKLWWYGEDRQTNPTFSNVARGTINGNIINLEVADVPKGKSSISDNLTLKAFPNNKLVIQEMTGKFNGSVWKKNT
jgi:hypothetical protein